MSCNVYHRVILLFPTNGSDGLAYGIFSLTSRTISGALVAVCLGLIIGRLDSKFINPKKWELWLLYLYASIQLLFTLFDPELFKAAIARDFTTVEKVAVESYFEFVKTIVLYFILFLKTFFIFFVIKIYKRDMLFEYFLLGSKLNDEIKNANKSSK